MPKISITFLFFLFFPSIEINVLELPIRFVYAIINLDLSGDFSSVSGSVPQEKRNMLINM
jgi:hypothetical protein